MTGPPAPAGPARRTLLAAAAAAAAAAGRTGRAQPVRPFRIGDIGDFSGPYSAISGENAVTAARMAIQDFGGQVLGRPIELVTADHQNKPDIGLGIVREWFGPGDVSMITDVTNSAVAFGIQPLLTERRKVAIYSTVGNPDLFGRACVPGGLMWGRDNWSPVVAPVDAFVAGGMTTFFLIVADYAFGKTMESDATAAILGSHGTVAGVARHPFNAADFSSYLITARSSGAKVVLLLNGGADFVNCYKQAVEFGLPKAQAVLGPIVFLTDVASLGLPTAQGLQCLQAWYWDRTDETRAWARRFFTERRQMPNDCHAATYSAVLQYLRAVQRVGRDDAEAVVSALKSAPFGDVYAHGTVREDGRMLFDQYLTQVKAPAESTGPWDDLRIVRTIPAADGFRPLAAGGCPLGGKT